MDTASFTGLLETIMYIIVIYYVIKFLSRLFLPVIVNNVVQKAEESFRQHYNQQHKNYHSHNQDEIIYDTQKSTKPRETKKVGEYVDFEEID